MRKAGVLAAATTFIGVIALSIGSAGLAAASGNGTPGVGASNPPGNNGTIKLETSDLVPVGSADANHPHVTCTFSLNFFGFDLGTQSATVNFKGQPPSGKFVAVSPLVGPNTFTFTGHGAGNTLDTSQGYSLDVTGLYDHPRQGYHIKVLVTVSGSQGADSKYKVFWYEPCGSGSGGQVSTTTTTTVAPTTTTLPTSTTSTSTTTTTLAPLTGGGGLTGPTTTVGTPPPVVNGNTPLSSAGTPTVGGQTPQVASGQAPELGSGSTPEGAATDLGFFQPNWFGNSQSPWILMIVAGILLAGTGAGIGYRMRRA